MSWSSAQAGEKLRYLRPSVPAVVDDVAGTWWLDPVETVCDDEIRKGPVEGPGQSRVSVALVMNPSVLPVETPYYAVIFTSLRTEADDAGYAAMAERMVALASQQPGFLGVESARGSDGVGITVSYWESLEAIRLWREQAEHRLAQAGGRSRWYQQYRLRVCRVERDAQFERES